MEPSSLFSLSTSLRSARLPPDSVNPITHPDLKRAQLRGPDLEKFRKQVNQSLAERDREAKAIVSVAD